MSASFNKQEVAALVARIEAGELIPPSQYGRIVATFEHLQEQAELLAQVAADLQRQIHVLRAVPEPATCSRCYGCGKIADSESGEPWSAWMELPVQSAVAIIAGIVKPIPCPDCGGTGKEEA